MKHKHLRKRKFNFEYSIALVCIAMIVMIILANASTNTELEEVTGETVIYSEPEIHVAETYEPPTVNMTEVDLISKVVFGEARGCTPEQQAAVVWCILNRYDAGFGTIEEIIKAPNQFSGWNVHNPVINSIKEIVVDVLTRYEMEKICVGNVGRVLPKEYLWFNGNGEVNIYRCDYNDYDNMWDWSLPNPYESR